MYRLHVNVQIEFPLVVLISHFTSFRTWLLKDVMWGQIFGVLA